jgi:hypothetical protein
MSEAGDILTFFLALESLLFNPQFRVKEVLRN